MVEGRGLRDVVSGGGTQGQEAGGAGKAGADVGVEIWSMGSGHIRTNGRVRRVEEVGNNSASNIYQVHIHFYIANSSFSYYSRVGLICP